MEQTTKGMIASLRALQTKSGRNEQGVFLVEGEKLVAEALASGWKLKSVFSTQDALKKSKLSFGGLPIYFLYPEDAKKISAVETSPGLFAVVEKPETTGLPSSRVVAAFVDINDPGNLGTMIRTADWFGVTDVIVTRDTVDHFNDKVVRSSMGSIFHVAVHVAEDFETELIRMKEAGYYLLGTDVHGTVGGVDSEKHICLLMGSESHGLDPKYKPLLDATYTIPGHGRAESLNVGVSFGIILSHLI